MSLLKIIENPKHHSNIIYTDNISEDLVRTIQDIRAVIYETFTINDARRLSDIGLQKAEQGKKIKYVFLIQKEITRQAQHALLKTCEEPVENICFFFVLPHNTFLLPTLLSRSLVYTQHNEQANTIAQEYIALSPADRIKKTDALWEDKQGVQRFLNALEQFVAQSTDPKKHENAKVLYEIRNMYKNPIQSRHVLHRLAFSWYDRDICTQKKQ